MSITDDLPKPVKGPVNYCKWQNTGRVTQSLLNGSLHVGKLAHSAAAAVGMRGPWAEAQLRLPGDRKLPAAL